MKRLVLTLALAVAAQPAVAETSPQEARVILAKFGACIVKREPAAARDFVLSGDFFEARRPEHARIFQRECYPDQSRNARMGFSSDVLRGAMAEALLAPDLARIDVNGFTAIPPLRWAEPRPVKTIGDDGKPLNAKRIASEQKWFAVLTGDVLRARLGECVVRTNPDAARGVLTAPINIPAELAALQAISPALSQCIVAGQTVGFDRMTLRGTIAVAFYRLANAPKPAEVTR